MASDTIPIRQGEELDTIAIENYLREQLTDLPEEYLTIQQFSFGKSNLTYQLKMGEWEAVLRRPPLGPVAPKAHDMEREYKILKEISPHFSAAPKPYLFADESVIGSPFFVMERKRGIVLDTDFPEGIMPGRERCKSLSETMVNHLVELHSIDYTKTKLTEMTKPEGFMERQVVGWIRRYERAETDIVEGVEQLKQWMLKNVSESKSESKTPSIIHYDYKLNNAMFNEEMSEMVGLFDWEMTTVGDPLADLGVAMSYWIQPDDPDLLKKGMGKPPVTVTPGFMTRDEFMEHYARNSGRDLANMNFYQTFAYFKLAVICQQIYYRWKKGQTKDPRFAHLDKFVSSLIQYALYTAEKK
ncbi:phosphotransferase family protein [Mesobacillus subterraneus]|uniref:phosphotransferase family protein n=1 Tax=Mesobacillus subterraneus TaxID=285983 RepID=UPI00203AC3DF|nr:phosphotransferase family protein [Mesobacillus subterraneus]MCM3664785.1 phosphotransferase family protein [Mesobacillus subterraneus]MCM3681874.1 phosphotransferase family protein [Mesobacillus subterraneus]